MAEEITLQLPRGGTTTVSSTETVVISDEGERFHRSGRLAFQTACKIEFSDSTEQLPIERAIDRGYAPCVKYACFG